MQRASSRPLSCPIFEFSFAAIVVVHFFFFNYLFVSFSTAREELRTDYECLSLVKNNENRERKSIDFGWLTTLMRCERLFNFINRRKLNERTTEENQIESRFFLYGVKMTRRTILVVVGSCCASSQHKRNRIFFASMSPAVFLPFFSIFFLISIESSWHMLRCIYSSDVRILDDIKRRRAADFSEDSWINFLQLQLMWSTGGRSKYQANA